MNNWQGRSIISIHDFSHKDLIHVLETGKRIEAMKTEKKNTLLKDKVIATLFFEPSTRTRLSFESAAQQLGARIIGFSEPNSSSASKGETVYDTIKMVERYADIIVIRHPKEGAARLAAASTEKIVINAGDGANQHPTQTFLDLYTIKKTQGKITGLKVAFVGDLKYGRTVHSLAVALSHFSCELFFVSPESLAMPSDICDELSKRKTKWSVHKKIEECIANVDVLYMTRIQKERFGDLMEYQRVKDIYILRKETMNNVKKNLKILHPLPRVNEIHRDVDELSYAAYFDQAANGIPVRQALLALVAGAVR